MFVLSSSSMQLTPQDSLKSSNLSSHPTMTGCRATGSNFVGLNMLMAMLLSGGRTE